MLKDTQGGKFLLQFKINHLLLIKHLLFSCPLYHTLLFSCPLYDTLRTNYENIFHDNDSRSETEKYKDILNPNDIVACKRICGYLLAAFEKRLTA